MSSIRFGTAWLPNCHGDDGEGHSFMAIFSGHQGASLARDLDFG